MALKHDETMLINANSVTGTPGMTQPFTLGVHLMLVIVLVSASTAVAQQTTKPLQTERFTRTNYDSLEYQWTLEDPATFTDSITAVLPIAKVTGLLYEYACQEGNYGLLNILRSARAEEQRAADSGPQVRAR